MQTSHSLRHIVVIGLTILILGGALAIVRWAPWTDKVPTPNPVQANEPEKPMADMARM